MDFYNNQAKKNKTNRNNIAAGNYSSAVVTLRNLYDALTSQAAPEKVRQVIMKDIIKYGILMAGVVTAKSSDEVQEAIETVALPAGSSRIKRESLVNISLNAFVGLHGGHETIQHADNGNALNAFGLSAPVGVAFSWGTALL